MPDKSNLWMLFALLTVACWGLYGIFLHMGQLEMKDPVHGPGKAIWLSLIAGALGAVGAFGVLLAFGAKGQPAVVMAIIFAGAPVVNAVVALSLHPPAGGIAKLPWQFIAGIVLAAVGGTLVTLYKPAPGKPTASPPPSTGQPK